MEETKVQETNESGQEPQNQQQTAFVRIMKRSLSARRGTGSWALSPRTPCFRVLVVATVCHQTRDFS